MSLQAPHTSRYPIRFSHTDMAGIVYYPNYFDMFQALVEDWFDHWLGISYAKLLAERKVGLPSVKVGCEFLRPVRIAEVLELTVEVQRTGRASIALAIDGVVAGEPCLRGEVVLVSLSLDSFRSIPIPDDVARRIEEYRQACAA